MLGAWGTCRCRPAGGPASAPHQTPDAQAGAAQAHISQRQQWSAHLGAQGLRGQHGAAQGQVEAPLACSREGRGSGTGRSAAAAAAGQQRGGCEAAAAPHHGTCVKHWRPSREAPVRPASARQPSPHASARCNALPTHLLARWAAAAPGPAQPAPVLGPGTRQGHACLAASQPPPGPPPGSNGDMMAAVRLNARCASGAQQQALLAERKLGALRRPAAGASAGPLPGPARCPAPCPWSGERPPCAAPLAAH